MIATNRPNPMHQTDRREFQRLKLSKPILGTFAGANALLLDIGLAGAFIEHYGIMTPGATGDLTFRWQGQDVSYTCEVVRSAVVKDPGGDGKSSLSQSGLRFVAAHGNSATLLQEFITSFVGNILAAQKANAAGELGRSAGETILATLGQARRSRSRGFVTYQFRDGAWFRTTASSSHQPHDGFTVADHEDEVEVESLCRAFEAADDEGRQLIRLVAELTIAQG